MSFESSVHAKAIELTKLAVEMTTAAGSGHPTSAASLAHLVTVLMYSHMRYNPAQPDDSAADRLVLSEGHACPIIYAAAADLGIAIGREHRRAMTRDDALRLRQIDSPIDGHPNPAEGFPFFPAATGSLGQGLSVAAGLALAARLDGLDKRVFCLIGDGESREGQIWEAIGFLLDYHLVEVCPIFNCNGYGQVDRVSSQQSPETTAAKLQAAGFDLRAIDGHDPNAIRQALKEHEAHCHDAQAKPFAIVAKTVKAWGFTSVLGSDVHGKAVPEEDLEKAFEALDRMGERINATWTEGDLKVPPPPVAKVSHDKKAIARAPSFTEALKQFGREKLLAAGKLAPRKAYGVALQTLGHLRPHIVSLDADVKNSTYSEYFSDDPLLRGRSFECRIAEQNMISCAVGLAAGGKTPFVSTFGKFMARGYDQFEMGMISRSNLKMVGTHVGVNIAADGPSQMALPDVAYFRAWTTVRNRAGQPAIYLLNPADAYAAYALTLAMAEHSGACYLRALRPDVPLLYVDNTRFTLGGHEVLVQGNDLLIVAAGYMVHEAMKAVDQLRADGVQPTLVDLYSIPFDGEAIATLAAENDGRVLTVEDNYGAGIGSSVADALLERGGSYSLKQMYVQRIPKSGRTPDDLLRDLELSDKDIVKNAESMLGVAAH
jgi:transketolase